MIKSPAPALSRNGAEITLLFDEAAEQSGEQPSRLAPAILAFAANVYKPEDLSPTLEWITARHVSTLIKPEQHTAADDALLPAIRFEFGDLASDAILSAWGEAYWYFAGILIGCEHELCGEDG